MPVSGGQVSPALGNLIGSGLNGANGTTGTSGTPGAGGGTSDAAIAQTQAAMSDAIKTNAAITALTMSFQVAMQGINATREAATEAYKKAGEANHSMHQ